MTILLLFPSSSVSGATDAEYRMSYVRSSAALVPTDCSTSSNHLLFVKFILSFVHILIIFFVIKVGT
jgi:hypothetical protein